ncbi:unnamed protein product [Symbiodinium sp. CCMP2456]|nr:unnamed protein product [Symbiodinium sp. CCMP2456]
MSVLRSCNVLRGFHCFCLGQKPRSWIWALQDAAWGGGAARGRVLWTHAGAGALPRCLWRRGAKEGIGATACGSRERREESLFPPPRRAPWRAPSLRPWPWPWAALVPLSVAGGAGRARRLSKAGLSLSLSPSWGGPAQVTDFVGVTRRRIRAAARLHKASRRAADASDEGEVESTDMSFLQKLIQKQREATEIGICTEDWHPDLFDDVPEGYRDALEAGIDLVDVLANGNALKLLASTPPNKSTPRFSVRVAPKPTLGLGYMVHRSVVQHYTVLSPLQQTMKRLNVGEIETLTIHSLGQGRMHFPFWVYDAVVEAYQPGTRRSASRGIPRPPSASALCL